MGFVFISPNKKPKKNTETGGLFFYISSFRIFQNRLRCSKNPRYFFFQNWNLMRLKTQH